MSNDPDSQRKLPKQSRSQSVVDAIYEATVRLLPVFGKARLTTRRVAEKAGISVGSLYQYFPNKEAILAGLMNLFSKSQMNAFLLKLAEVEDKPFEEATRVLAREAFELMLNDRKTIRALFTRVDPARLTAMIAFHRDLIAWQAKMLRRHFPGQTDQVYSRVAFIGTASIVGVIDKMILDETQTHSIDDLTFEFTRMYVSYVHTAIGVPALARAE